MISSTVRRLKILFLFAMLLSTIACVGFEKTFCSYLDGGEWIEYSPNTGTGGCCTTDKDCVDPHPPEPEQNPDPDPGPESEAESESSFTEGTRKFTVTSCEVTSVAGHNCKCGDTDGVLTISGDDMTVQYLGRPEMAFHKQEEGHFETSSYWGTSNLSIRSLTLLDTGFILIDDLYDTSTGLKKCTFENVAIFVE